MNIKQLQFIIRSDCHVIAIRQSPITWLRRHPILVVEA